MMKPLSLNLPRLAAIFLLIVALSGCALGERRLRSTTVPELPQMQQSQPTTTLQMTAPDIIETARPATDASIDAQAEDLLNMINTLEAANQAGDSLDDLP